MSTAASAKNYTAGQRPAGPASIANLNVRLAAPTHGVHRRADVSGCRRATGQQQAPRVMDGWMDGSMGRALATWPDRIAAVASFITLCLVWPGKQDSRSLGLKKACFFKELFREKETFHQER